MVGFAAVAGLLLAATAHADDLRFRSEVELLTLWGNWHTTSTASCWAQTTAGSCVGGPYRQDSGYSNGLVRASTWHATRSPWLPNLGLELRMGAEVISSRGYESLPGQPVVLRTATSVLPQGLGLVHLDWQYLGLGAGVRVYRNAAVNDLFPAGYVRLGPRWLHIALHSGDSGWMMVAVHDTALGVGTDFDVPAAVRIGGWPLWSNMPLRVEGWLGIPSVGSVQACGVRIDGWPQVGLRVAGRRGAVRLGWVHGFAGSGSNCQTFTIPNDWTMASPAMWLLGLAVPL